MSKKHRATGGKSSEPIKKVAYNAKGTKVLAEAEDDAENFKRGGHKPKRKAGGRAHGGRAAKRADKPHRSVGGATKTPFTRAATGTPRPGMNQSGTELSKHGD